MGAVYGVIQNDESRAGCTKDQGRKFARGGLEEQVLAWDFVQRNARPVEGFGISVDQFADGSVLAERENLAFPNLQVLAEWLKEKNE